MAAGRARPGRKGAWALLLTALLGLSHVVGVGAGFFCTKSIESMNVSDPENAITGKQLAELADLQHMTQREFFWLLGIVLYMSGCFSTVIGMNLVRLVHEKRKTKPQGGQHAADDKGIWSDPVFIIGWFLMVVMTALLDSAAIYFAPIAILAPMSGFTVLINVLVAQKVNNEKILWHDLLVAVLIMPGIVLAIIFGPHDSPRVTQEFLQCQGSRLTFLLYEAVVLVLFFCVHRLSFKMYTRPSPDIWEPNMDFAQRHPSLSKLRPLTLLIVGGGFGGQQMLWTKLVLGCLQTTIAGDENMFATPYPYVLLLLMAACTICQLTGLNRGLAAEGTLVAVPLYNTLFMGFTLMSSAVFNETFDDMPTENILFFFAGLGLVMMGVLLILKRPRPFDYDTEKRPLLDEKERRKIRETPISM